jgi:hypothetical protein
MVKGAFSLQDQRLPKNVEYQCLASSDPSSCVHGLNLILLKLTSTWDTVLV